MRSISVPAGRPDAEAGWLLRRVHSLPFFYKVLSANTLVVLLGAVLGTWLSVAYARDVPGASPILLVGLFAIAGLSLSLLVNFVVLKATFRPLEALDRSVRRVRQGDLGARVDQGWHGDPRLDLLAETVNQALDSLARQQAQSQALSSAVIQAQEEERKRIARDLHDQTAQSLTSMLLRLSALERSSDPVVRTSTVELLALTAQALEDVRRMAVELRPALLDDLGLAPALAAMAEQYQQRLGIPVALHADRVSPRLSSDVELVLFRIAQEALTNVAKHASARSVSVRLRAVDGRVQLTVDDDGRGFEARAVLADRNRGLGLFGMQERASLVGGALHLESVPGGGTRVVVEVDAAEVR